MVAISFYLRPDSSQSQRTAVARVEKQGKQLMRDCAAAVKVCAREGNWKGAVNVAVKGARLSPAEIADRLGVMRSTVSRWMDGSMTPHKKAESEFVDKLIEAIKAQID